MDLALITSELPLVELQALRADYCDYDLVGSTERAAVYIKATRSVLVRALRRMAQERGEEIEFDTAITREELRKAEAWRALQLSLAAGPRQYTPDPCWREE